MGYILYYMYILYYFILYHFILYYITLYNIYIYIYIYITLHYIIYIILHYIYIYIYIYYIMFQAKLIRIPPLARGGHRGVRDLALEGGLGGARHKDLFFLSDTRVFCRLQGPSALGPGRGVNRNTQRGG